MQEEERLSADFKIQSFPSRYLGGSNVIARVFSSRRGKQRGGWDQLFEDAELLNLKREEEAMSP